MPNKTLDILFEQTTSAYWSITLLEKPTNWKTTLALHSNRTTGPATFDNSSTSSSEQKCSLTMPSPSKTCRKNLSLTPSTVNSDDSAEGSLMALQREHIREVLEKENGNKSASARTLGVERRKLYRMMNQHEIDT
tara:strand:- start:171 stop:575 length:405 start_codon:yes stop_codon:yes gene_type:complete